MFARPKPVVLVHLGNGDVVQGVLWSRIDVDRLALEDAVVIDQEGVETRLDGQVIVPETGWVFMQVVG